MHSSFALAILSLIVNREGNGDETATSDVDATRLSLLCNQLAQPRLSLSKLSSVRDHGDGDDLMLCYVSVLPILP